MSELFGRYLSLVLCGALVIIGLSLDNVGKVCSLRATTTQTNNPPLVFEAESRVRSVCAFSCLVIEVSLTNASSQAVAIDAVGLRYQIEARKFTSLPAGGSEQVMTKRGDYGPGQYNDSTYRVLKAGETYRTTLNLPLTDKFFRGQGSYKVKFTYGQFREYAFQGVKLFKGTVESNELDFSSVKCSAKKVKKAQRFWVVATADITLR
jgi:hypothetical protein